MSLTRKQASEDRMTFELIDTSTKELEEAATYFEDYLRTAASGLGCALYQQTLGGLCVLGFGSSRALSLG